MRYCLILLSALVITISSPAMAACEPSGGSNKRGVALLIGVSDYRAPANSTDEEADGWTPLRNAVADVELICHSLSDAGFGVTVLRNPTFSELDLAIADFHDAAAESDHAIVYYAGHGFEYGGKQYIVPVDAPTRVPGNRLLGNFMPLDRVVTAAGDARKFSLFLMDACRTREPVVSVSGEGEAGATASAIGLFTVPNGAVLFSTVAGRPALDEAPVGSAQSPFAQSLASSLAIPGLELNSLYAQVHEDVVERTGEMIPHGPQYPALYKVAPERFYLVEPPSEEAIESAANAPGNGLPEIAFPDLETLATVDEPILVRNVLAKHSFAELLQVAESGEAVAQFFAGYGYHLGLGVEQDLAKAEHWLRKAAAQEHPGGMTELAYFLQKRAEEDDPAIPQEQVAAWREEALALYEGAVAQDYAKAQSHLGFALHFGALGPVDTTRSIALFDAASKAGHVYATFALTAYSAELRDEAEARLFALSEAGDVEGDNWICELYFMRGKAHDVTEQCERAALGSYAGSRAIYAVLLSQGLGGATSADDARYWAKLALSEPELRQRSLLTRLATQIAQ